MSKKRRLFQVTLASLLVGSAFAMMGSHQISANGVSSKPADSTIVCFEGDVLPVFKSKCATSNCHNSKSAKDGVILDNYDNTMKTLRLSVATDPMRNKLRGVISRNKMPPQNHTALTDAEKNLVYLWLQQGMKNDPCSFILAPLDSTH